MFTIRPRPRMYACCIAGCNNVKSRSTGRHFRYFRIPKVKYHEGKATEELTMRRRKAWIAAINSDEITFHCDPMTVVCSKHFHGGKPAYEQYESHPDWVPSLVMGYETTKEVQDTSLFDERRSGTDRIEKPEQQHLEERLDDMSTDVQHKTSVEFKHQLTGSGQEQSEKAALWCGANFCKSHTDPEHQARVTFHRFPYWNPRRESWIVNMRRAGQASETWQPGAHESLCSAHFTPGCFVRKGQTVRLKDTAVPTIFDRSEIPCNMSKKMSPFSPRRSIRSTASLPKVYHEQSSSCDDSESLPLQTGDTDAEDGYTSAESPEEQGVGSDGSRQTLDSAGCVSHHGMMISRNPLPMPEVAIEIDVASSPSGSEVKNYMQDNERGPTLIPQIQDSVTNTNCVKPATHSEDTNFKPTTEREARMHIKPEPLWDCEMEPFPNPILDFDREIHEQPESKPAAGGNESVDKLPELSLDMEVYTDIMAEPLPDTVPTMKYLVEANADESDTENTETESTSSKLVESDTQMDYDSESDLDIDENSDFYEWSSDSSSQDQDSDGALKPKPAFGEVWSEKLYKMHVESFTQRVGVVHDLPVGSSPLDYFHLLLPETFFQTLADETNSYAIQVQTNASKAGSKWKPTTAAEMKLLVAIHIMMNIHRLPSQGLYWSSDDRLNVETVSKLLSINRFRKLNQYLHLSDHTKAVPLGQPGYDPLHRVRPLLDLIGQNFPAHYKPNREISFSRSVIRKCGKLSFKRLHRHSRVIHVWCCEDPATGYLLAVDVRSDKSKHISKGNLAHEVALTVGKEYLGKNHHFYFSNISTSVHLMRELLKRRTYACGSCPMSKSKSGWPKDLVFVRTKNGRQLKKGEAKMRQMGVIVATAWRDDKTQSLLSTGLQPVMEAVEGERGKDYCIAQPVLMYKKCVHEMKVHQRRMASTVKRTGRQLWQHLFWFLIEACIVNAFVIYKQSSTPGPKPRKIPDLLTFQLGLYDGLIKNNVGTRRRTAPASGSFAGRATFDLGQHPLTRLFGRKGNCVQCTARDRRAPCGRRIVTVFGCSLCKVHLCKGRCFAEFHAELLQ